MHYCVNTKKAIYVRKCTVGGSAKFVQLRGAALKDWIKTRLSDLRLRRKGTNQEFADLAGISVSHVHKAPKTGGITVETLANWLYACGTDLPKFFAELETVEDKEEIEYDRIIMDFCRRAINSPPKQVALVGVLKGLFPDEAARLDKGLPLESPPPPIRPRGRGGK